MNCRVLIVVLLLPLALLTSLPAPAADDNRPAATFYVARISSEAGWEDIFVDPVRADYIDDYLLVAGLSRGYARFYSNALKLEAEAQTAYHFGQQEYWEFNVIPVMARWLNFPWNHSVKTTAAFGLGLSYCTKLPNIEVELEGESRQTLVYWVAEITAGLPNRNWAASLRLHHRSVAYGLMGDEGGMNAVGLGLRWQF